MNARESARGKICIALDFSEGRQAIDLARRLEGKAGWFKVGLELFVSEGPSIVSGVARFGRVFLDLKLHDIPNTVSRASAAAARSGAAMINVHASGGREMMKAARDAVGAEASRIGIPAPAVIAVTLLTSLDESSLRGIPFHGMPIEIVAQLARLSSESGLDGVVCSAGDLEIVRRECGLKFLTVVPGRSVRPPRRRPTRSGSRPPRRPSPPARRSSSLAGRSRRRRIRRRPSKGSRGKSKPRDLDQGSEISIGPDGSVTVMGPAIRTGIGRE